MRYLPTALAACAALAAAPALAGPGCDGGAHDVTARTETVVEPAPEQVVATGPEAPEILLDLLAFNTEAAPGEALPQSAPAEN